MVQTYAYNFGFIILMVESFWTAHYVRNVRRCSQRSSRWQGTLIGWGCMPFLVCTLLIVFPWNLSTRLAIEYLLGIIVFVSLFIGAGVLDWLKEVALDTAP